MVRSGEAVKKVAKGVIRARARVEGRVVVDVQVTGDFLLYPEEALWKLEEELRGVLISEVPARVSAALEGVKLVGCSPSDFAEAVLEAARRAGGLE